MLLSQQQESQAWWDTLLSPLYDVVSWIIRGFYEVISPVLGKDSGWTWALSIVGLVIVIRILLIPLFVRQIRASRNMALLQPKIKELQKKYGHDRQKMGEEMMKLYKESGTNPFSSCMPILLQSPIFIALFRLLDRAAKSGTANGFMTEKQAGSFGHAKLFDHIPIKDTFLHSNGLVSVQILAAVLVVAMTVTTFTTQRQLMTKNMPKDAMTGPYAQQQKMLLYVLPVVFAVGGIAFPIGVLCYWTTTNLWTMGQQFYVIRRNPAPGTPAFEAKQKRDRAKGRIVDEPTTANGAPVADEVEQPRQPRQQPKRQSKQQRKRSGGKPGGAKPKPRARPDDGESEGKTA